MSEIFSGFINEIPNYIILSRDISNFKAFLLKFKHTIAPIFTVSDFGLVLAHTLITK